MFAARQTKCGQQHKPETNPLQNADFLVRSRIQFVSRKNAAESL
jgi:hypothetical protein